MYLMIADEADQDGSKEFLVFRAVFFPSAKLLTITNEIERLRRNCGYPVGTVLKSAVNTRPKNVSPSQHAKIKNEILALAQSHGCKICCYVVPHDISRKQKHADRMKFGTNTLLAKFDQFLRETGNVGGMALFDNTTDFKQSNHLKDAFNLGLLKYDDTRIPLKNIVKVGTTNAGMSHLNSVTDIVVGSFRFVVNEPDKDEVGMFLYQRLAQLMWGRLDQQGFFRIEERGLVIRPQKIELNKYKADIASFISRMNNYGSSTA